ncbi:MAG TPA: DUF4258 domain-containing protein [Saprospiraceae bacterium]|nr:DUF4258 domain-containing protein [Saprospiraceae bacterium]HMP23501.1 DUF4258 domain-containing protein [Saprospiraceae bacterium]
MAEISISNHARGQIRDQGISEAMVLEIISSPEQTIRQSPEKIIYQSINYFEEDKRNFLGRVFVNIIEQPNLVITVYRTSKIDKYYWKDED